MTGGLLETLIDARNPDRPLDRRLAALFELKGLRSMLSQPERCELALAEEELAGVLRTAGPVSTREYDYKLGPDGRIRRVLPF
jgi:hypothetical protein